MSGDDKSEDKKEIEDEEREKMLNEENRREEPKGEVEKMKKALEDSEKEKEKEGKKKIPIGGIRIPGFLRSRSREKNNKDSEGEQEEDLLHDAPPGTPPPADRDSIGTGQDQTPPHKRLPLKITNPFKKGKEAELGAAGLASMETLDDKSGEHGEDGMESVKLDVEEKDGDKADEVAKQDWRDRIRFLSKFRLIVGGVVLFLVLLIIIIVVAASGPRPSGLPATHASGRTRIAYTSCGPVEGLVEDGAFVFRGLPYAIPPLGERRWTHSSLIENLDDCWNGTWIAHNSSSPCLQMYSNGTVDGVEDCLTLDVYTPRVGYQSPISVVVLVGTETLLGGSPGVLVPSAKLARDHEVIFVRPNFRLGVMGFLAANPLSSAAYPRSSGNYGLSDILAVLRWVHLNIDHFGGNKSSVTVLGHRAGATLVTALLASRKANGLLQHAWLSSGAASFPGKSLHDSEMRNIKYLKNLSGCTDQMDAACLRALDADELMSKIPDSWRAPVSDLPHHGDEAPHEWLVLDGAILQSHPFEVFSSNTTLPFKIVIGTTAHVEATTELRRRYDDWGGAVTEHVQSSVLGTNSSIMEEAMRRYGIEWPGFVSMVSDIRTVCPLLNLASRLQRAGAAFYVVTQLRGSMADASADAAVFMGRFKPQTTEERRYMSAMENLFYRFVYWGDVRRDTNAVLLIGQDTNPSLKYPNCDLWYMHDIVPRYARVD